VSDSGQTTVAFAGMLAVGSSLALAALACGQAAISLAERQAAADTAALAGARALMDGGIKAARADALAIASANGAGTNATADVDSSRGRVKVTVDRPLMIGVGPAAVEIDAVRVAVAEVDSGALAGLDPGPGDYSGPFAWRQGKPMRPDVAIAFDRMDRAARADGVSISIVSAWRSSAEQARLFAAHPDPRWVARPGHSLHRLGTELDLGSASAYAWLAANCERFGFTRRYSWEPWHFGFTRSPGSASVGFARSGSGRGVRSAGGALQGWVPGRFRSVILAASISHGVSAALLAAQIRAESDFNPRVVSSAGAMGISQLMPDEAKRFHVNPFDPGQAVGAQAALMHEHLARFGSVPLALAAYNAGPNAVARCGCVPPYPETRSYVARILRWLADAAGTPLIRLVS
jgi:hypothetical protein